MSANKKPRKAYRPRHVAVNNLELALHGAATPTSDNAQVLTELAEVIKALREGVATEHQWSIAAGSIEVALAIERGGVVRGLYEHLEAAGKALDAIHERTLRAGGGRWVRATLYFNEIDAIQTMYDLHKFQVSKISRHEFVAALDSAQRAIKAQGNRPTLVAPQERMAA